MASHYFVKNRYQAFDDNGNPGSGWKVNTYVPGTTTPKTTYSDKALTSANSNPVVLDSRGEAHIYADGSIKIVLTDENDVTITTDDDIDGTPDMDSVDIDGGTIDGTTIGGTTPSAGAFTTLSFTGALTNPTNFFIDKSRYPTISNGTDSEHDIDFAAGLIPDITGQYLLSGSAMTKQIDATWAAGTDQGGLFSGTVAVDTWYYVFLIRKDSDGTIDGGFDTSKTAANIPTGYTAYRRIGCILTDASSNIIAFKQLGSSFVWIDCAEDINDSATGTTAKTATLTAPPLETIDANFSAHANYNAALSHILITSLFQTDATPTSTLRDLGVTSNSNRSHSNMSRKVNTSSQIRYRTSADATLRIHTSGWVDELIE